MDADRGDVHGLTSSYQSDLKRLVGFFCAHGIDRSEAEDLGNETILRTLIHLKRHGRTQDHLGPLTKTIARNLLVERRRKSSTVTLVPLTEQHEVPDADLDPFEHAAAVERRDTVRLAVKSLPPRHRRVVTMWMEGTSPVEIARELGIKRNAVDAILHRAKRGLATRLGPRSSWGLVALPFIRLRDGVRHGFRFASSFVPAASPGVEAGFAIATVAIATALTFAMPVSTGPSDVSTRDDVGGPVVTRTHAPSKVPVTRVAKEPVAGVVVQPPGNVGTRYDVGSAGGEIKNPATGKKDDAGLDLWYDFDEKDPSPIDPVLRDAGESLMEVAQ